MSPTEPDGIDWQRVLTIALDVACVGYLVWMLFPGLRLELQMFLRSAKDQRKARVEWERMTHQLAYETFEVRSAMEGDTDGLARRLDVAG